MIKSLEGHMISTKIKFLDFEFSLNKLERERC